MAMNNFLLWKFIFILLTVECHSKVAPFQILQPQEEKPSDIREMIPLLRLLQKPKDNDKDIKYLLGLLGPDYNPKYTSITEPTQARDPTVFQKGNMAKYILMKTNPKIGKEIKNLNIELQRSNGEKRKAGSKFVHKLQNWLYNLSKCPVRYKWHDMGENVFPRFIKRGLCSKKKTCSFPAGMKCQPSKWISLNVLLYTCLKSYNSVADNCKWRPLMLNILTECQCGCR